MSRLLAHLLLSFALIVQGIGVACAYGPMKVAAHAPAMASMIDSTAGGMADHCNMPMPCPDCADENHDTGNPGCLHISSLSTLDFQALSVPQLARRDTHVVPAAVSLVDHRQVPPTPPPIA